MISRPIRYVSLMSGTTGVATALTRMPNADATAS